MATIVEAFAVYEAMCTRQDIVVEAVVIERHRTHPDILGRRTIPWKEFTQLRNSDVAANFAEHTLYEQLQRHLETPCICDNSILFQIPGSEIRNGPNKIRLSIPENASLVPCNSPIAGCTSPATPIPCAEGETTKKRNMSDLDMAESSYKRRKFNWDL
jgi:hypothetical protein